MHTPSEETHRWLLPVVAVLLTAIVAVGTNALASGTFAEPSTVPPNSNTYAPLDTGPVANTKQGGLLLNTGGAPNGLLVQLGNVGVGTLNPIGNLDVENGHNTATICLNGNCTSKLPSGGGGVSASTVASCMTPNVGPDSGGGSDQCAVSCPTGYYRTACGWDTNNPTLVNYYYRSDSDSGLDGSTNMVVEGIVPQAAILGSNSCVCTSGGASGRSSPFAAGNFGGTLLD